MTNSINAPIGSGFPGKAAGRLSMISMLAISVSMAAAPANAQDMVAPDMPDMTVSPAPALAAPAATAQPAPAAEPTSTLTQARADDLATEGGFDAATVAPEALAQIESEQQARKDAAAAAAAKSAAAARAAPTRATSAPVTDSFTQAAPAFDADGSVALAESSADPVTVIPMISPVAESAAAPEAMPADGETDWSLLAALAAMLGIGSAGAYAATGRRSSKTRQAAALNAAIMPELRRDPVEADILPAGDAAPSNTQSEESNLSTKLAFAAFVANLPAFEAPLGKNGRGIKIGERRVVAAPKPYLGETDLSRPEGYFTANVDTMPTPQNPFLTRQKRVKRARFLDGMLARTNASIGKGDTMMTGAMQAPRSLQAAFG